MGSAAAPQSRKARAGARDQNTSLTLVGPVPGLFLCGTDQGYLGIVGAMLSGISMANKHALVSI